MTIAQIIALIEGLAGLTEKLWPIVHEAAAALGSDDQETVKAALAQARSRSDDDYARALAKLEGAEGR